MKYLILFFGFALAACNNNSSRDVEYYGNITAGPGGKNLVISAEHQGGWGRRECLLCHNASLGIHRGKNSALDAEALNELVRNNGGSSYCLTCHGPNGTN